MSWQYMPTRQTVDGEVTWTIHEVFDRPEGWTAEPITPVAESKKDLLKTLVHMLMDSMDTDYLDLDTGQIVRG